MYKNALGHIYVAEVMKRGEGENSTEQVDQIQFGKVRPFSSTPPGGEDILGCENSPRADFESDHLDGCRDEKQVKNVYSCQRYWRLEQQT